MLEDFVDVRGGGLLALGGARSFAEGGWAGTPLSDALPVVLDRGIARSRSIRRLELIVRPTRAGESHPATQITDKRRGRGGEVAGPAAAHVAQSRCARSKPGATVLLTGIDERGREQVVLAYQRYGRGKTLVLPVQDTWLWRMHAKMDVKDKTHHTFWQRLVALAGRRRARSRDGVGDARPRPEGRAGHAHRRGRSIPEYKGINDGRITRARHGAVGQGRRRADGVDRRARRRVPRALHADRRRPLQGRGRRHDQGRQGRRPRHDERARGAERRRVLRRRDARAAPAAARRGNRRPVLHARRDASTLVDAITYSGKGITVVEERELWDMPIVLLLLLGLMGGEWMYRRQRGLA